MRRWDERYDGWSDLELSLIAVGAAAVFMVVLSLIAGPRGPRSPQEGPEAPTPYQDCRELPGAHTWAPEDSTIVHLVCPEAP